MKRVEIGIMPAVYNHRVKFVKYSSLHLINYLSKPVHFPTIQAFSDKVNIAAFGKQLLQNNASDL